MSREHIAKVLKELRIKNGMTAKEVGEKIGKSGKTVSAWENNHGQPDAELLIALCDIYNVDDILNEFREPKKAEISDLNKEQLLFNYDSLNAKGKEKLLEYSNDLVNSRNYIEYEQNEKHA
jgi:transcriptional regulator with XRE-family HTH domain